MSYSHDSETPRNASTAAMGPIGHSAPISHHAGRYVLVDSEQSLYESTTSISHQQLIRAITVKISKGLELPVLALSGVGHLPAPEEDEKETARVFYVAAMRATQRLVIGVGVCVGLGGG
ncbi:3'-5' exonuclease [Rhodoferax sp.]|uniref:3'-5' exonuclease n=1 Tax=Rhodoferax sp. TaxID=50421 RepID=UPI00260EC65B|nr:3'-5' exonuclease [Rhodoferax sp.]MDD2918753.1 3'-5' exonuclease [Rhodoferax sp.]